MKPVRAFFAIDLPVPLRNTLKQVLSILESHVPKHAVRWIHLANLHITLQFVGNVHYEHLPELVKNVNQELATFKAFSLEINNLIFFPTQKHPQVIALEVGPSTILAELAHKIGLGIKATNYPVETRPFRGHLSLGRLKSNRKQPYTLDKIELPQFKTQLISEICLFASKATHEGQIYEPLSYCYLSSLG